MKRGLWFFKKGLMILVFTAAAILLFGFITMSLWNAILPAVIHVGTITFAQALGILVLCKILFGGFHGHRGGKWGGRGHWKQQMGEGMKEKWMNMSQEDREKFRQNWRGRCGGGWRRNAEEQRPFEEQKNTAE